MSGNTKPTNSFSRPLHSASTKRNSGHLDLKSYNVDTPPLKGSATNTSKSPPTTATSGTGISHKRTRSEPPKLSEIQTATQSHPTSTHHAAPASSTGSSLVRPPSIATLHPAPTSATHHSGTGSAHRHPALPADLVSAHPSPHVTSTHRTAEVRGAPAPVIMRADPTITPPYDATTLRTSSSHRQQKPAIDVKAILNEVHQKPIKQQEETAAVARAPIPLSACSPGHCRFERMVRLAEQFPKITAAIMVGIVATDSPLELQQELLLDISKTIPEYYLL